MLNPMLQYSIGSGLCCLFVLRLHTCFCYAFALFLLYFVQIKDDDDDTDPENDDKYAIDSL